MSVLDRTFAASEERHALIDDAYKDCGAFRLSAFRQPLDQKISSVDDFIGDVQRAMANADEFYSAGDDGRNFKLTGNCLTYTSSLSEGTVNDTVSVQIIKQRHAEKAVIIVPHWNAGDGDYLPLAKALARFGFDGHILTLPHHGKRAPPSRTHVANAFLNADLGAAIRSVRQAVLDVKLLTGWLKNSGYTDVYLVGASLGSCVAAVATAFDRRISRSALLLTAGDFADTVWTGRATAHIRRAIENEIDLEQLRKAWAIISPIHFSGNFTASENRLLVVSARRDEVVRFGIAKDFVDVLRKAGVDVNWQVLPCGHYTLGKFPFGIMMFANLLKFLRN